MSKGSRVGICFRSHDRFTLTYHCILVVVVRRWQNARQPEFRKANRSYSFHQSDYTHMALIVHAGKCQSPSSAFCELRSATPVSLCNQAFIIRRQQGIWSALSDTLHSKSCTTKPNRRRHSTDGKSEQHAHDENVT